MSNAAYQMENRIDLNSSKFSMRAHAHTQITDRIIILDIND